MIPSLFPRRHSRQLVLLLAMWSVNFLTTAWFFIERELLQGLCWALSIWALMGMTRSFMHMLDITQQMSIDLVRIFEEAVKQQAQGETKKGEA